MTKYFSILFILFLAIVAVACTSESTPPATVTAPVATDPLPTEPASNPVPIDPTAVPVEEPVTANDVMAVDDDGNTAVDTAALDNALSQIDSTAAE